MRVIQVGFVIALVFFAFYNPTPATTTAVVAQDRIAPMTRSEEIFVTALAQDSTVRVVSRTCDGSIRGSGFGANGVLFTNKHLTLETAEIKVDQLGQAVLRPVTGRSAVHDIAIAESVNVRELTLAAGAPLPGEPVILAGHAGGGELRIIQGVAQAEVAGDAYGIGGRVLLVDATTSGGFSGGPVLNRDGEVVAMLQGFDYVTGLTLAIPAETLSGSQISAGNIGTGACG